MKIHKLFHANSPLRKMLRGLSLGDERRYRRQFRQKALNIPSRLIGTLSTKREFLTEQDFLRGRPFTSENTWERLSNHYMSIRGLPVVFEYGSGLSTYYHLENLKEYGGGKLVAVEDNLDWYCLMRNSLQLLFSVKFDSYRENLSIDAHDGREKIDWEFTIDVGDGRHDGTLAFRYLYRVGHGRTGCGTKEEFSEYIDSLTEQSDVVIIDGRARKACVHHVLDNDLLSMQGLLVLYEAGRGHSSWPKKKQMSGTYDYQPEVQLLLKRGAELLDGTGRENWKGWIPNRRKSSHFSDYVPIEACFYYKRKDADS